MSLEWNVDSILAMLKQLDPRLYQVARWEAALNQRLQAGTITWPMERNDLAKLLDGPLAPSINPDPTAAEPHTAQNLPGFLPEKLFPVVNPEDFRIKCLLVTNILHVLDKGGGKYPPNVN
jgi:hypothetical protein